MTFTLKCLIVGRSELTGGWNSLENPTNGGSELAGGWNCLEASNYGCRT